MQPTDTANQMGNIDGNCQNIKLKYLPVEHIVGSLHMHHMHIMMDPEQPHKHKHHSLVHNHSRHSIDLDLLVLPSYQLHPKRINAKFVKASNR